MSDPGERTRDWRLYVQDMMEFAEQAVAYAEGLNQQAFTSDRRTYDAGTKPTACAARDAYDTRLLRSPPRLARSRNGRAGWCGGRRWCAPSRSWSG